MVRQIRPSVPSAEGTMLPHGRMSKDMRGKLYSIYLRPWTLCDTHILQQHVPHLRDLDVVNAKAQPDTEVSAEQPHKRRRYTTKQKADPADDCRAPEDGRTPTIRTHPRAESFGGVHRQMCQSGCEGNNGPRGKGVQPHRPPTDATQVNRSVKDQGTPRETERD